MYDVGLVGYLWSRTSLSFAQARALYFNTTDTNSYGNGRWIGLPLRLGD